MKQKYGRLGEITSMFLHEKKVFKKFSVFFPNEQTVVKFQYILFQVHVEENKYEKGVIKGSTQLDTNIFSYYN